MKIVQMIDSLTWGGAQKMVIHLTRTLRPMGMEIVVINLSDPAEPAILELLESAGARVYTFGFPRLFSPISFFRIVKFLLQERFDLIQAYLAYANIVGGLAGLLTGTPVIGSLRNTGSDPKRPSFARDLLDNTTLRFICKRVLANGYAVADHGHKRLGDDVPIDVIPNAVELIPSSPAEARRALRAQIIGDPDRFLILTVGRLDSRKGFPELIQAFADIHLRYPEAVLVIAGRGYLFDDLQKQIHTLKLEDRVFLLGKRDDVPLLLSAADIYVNSSSSEGMAVSILEAMAAGLPIIATTVGDASRMLDSGAGILVPPGRPDKLAEAMSQMLSPSTDRSAFGERAREHIQNHYSLPAWRQKILALYTEVVPKFSGYLKKLGVEE